MPMFLKAGWSVLPFGATRPGSPVPPLLIPDGAVRPADCACWHPDGRRFYVVEIKAKTEMRTLPGYGLDRRDDDTDQWQQIQLHDAKAGPALLIIWDSQKSAALAATVSMLRANEGLGGQESAQAGKRRRPGGQPFNQNAVRHGRYRRARLERRKLNLAELKVLTRAAHVLGLVPGRCRVRPLRREQVNILAERCPQTLRLAEAVGLCPPRYP